MIDIDELSMHKSMTVSDIEVDDFIAERNSDFLFNKKSLFKVPPSYAPKFRILTKQLRILFERAFIDGASDPTARPNETEFYFALEEYVETLSIKCKKGHYMPKYFIGKCEWCRVKKEKDKINY